MREILFRGKSTSDSHWVRGLLISIGDELSMIVSDNGLNRAYPVSTETVGQYTGLTDKNGNKVFEGDIIHVNYSITAPVGVGKAFRVAKHTVDYKAVVVFENCRFCLKNRNGEIYEMHITSGNIENIGNIHDNPESLWGDET